MTTQIKGNATSTFGGNIDVPQIITDAPAFSAYLSAPQSISGNTWTLIATNTKEFDTNNCYDTSNYRFTPNVSGYYQINYEINCISSINGPSEYYSYGAILKNGGYHQYHGMKYTGAYVSNDNTLFFSTMIYMNGTTDYVQMYYYHSNSSGATIWYESARTKFQGFLVRAV